MTQSIVETHYQLVKICPQVLTKMVDHAISGGDLEIMGLLFGDVKNDYFEVRDCVALPVEGTETRVNAGDDANEFIVKYIESEESIGYKYRAIGWYHSHPGYRCWLSAIDVATQRNHQRHQDPWLALVIDPMETLKRSKVDIGAFRTYSTSQPATAMTKIHFEVDSGGDISREKQEELGSSSNDYYSLPIEILWPPRTQAIMQRLGTLGHIEVSDDLIISGNAVLKALQPPDHRPLLAQLEKKSVSYKSGGTSEETPSISKINDGLTALRYMLTSNPSGVL
eukprot:Protomagalhaensia_wolfi_Nauph_80__2388@NODE_2570_length_1051_cov_4_802372_g2010_i0_p1_GENE_NODE_2570_length_1051_cov_4_802372_g2010_i0NODE_2570_length_1051_cov_4_802372_g2010_i0_p1_ORF_typecomplete_len281_score60_20JAB/PF01398_21/2_7e28ProkJAB/PF14464_6/1_9e10UPF0172/PF03665_13/0_021Herpes_gp2/PF05955_11/0_15_NODE_2570_length_1051_cov_4_802372_g2010_i021863